MSFRWSEDRNQFGVAGMIDADWNRKAGEGTHATLSPHDVHNTLVASGPDFRHKVTDQLPSGNLDIAPTILPILHLVPQVEMDGRRLKEALVTGQQVSADDISQFNHFW
jgi:arylsulfatase A-like enzyme